MKINCPFCKQETEYVYNIDKYRIVRCKNCATLFCENMPSTEEIKAYYDGFKHGGINLSNKYKIISNAYKDWFKSFNLPKDAKMLDIGGGGGFFSCCFEKFAFGKATYIDIDPVSCKFAQSLNISEVILGDVNDIKEKSDKKYDFIYSRHVIEHLVNPTKIIDSAIDLLNPKGIFILQFPNGQSFELLASKKFLNNRIEVLKKSNKNFSLKDIYGFIFSKNTGNDLYPPRHLWAISKKGIKAYLANKNDIEFTIETKSIRDKIYSPYYKNTHDYSRIVMFLLEKIHGGNHLICKIIKK